jgi:hypothetical protein
VEAHEAHGVVLDKDTDLLLSLEFYYIIGSCASVVRCAPLPLILWVAFQAFSSLVCRSGCCTCKCWWQACGSVMEGMLAVKAQLYCWARCSMLLDGMVCVCGLPCCSCSTLAFRLLVGVLSDRTLLRVKRTTWGVPMFWLMALGFVLVIVVPNPDVVVAAAALIGLAYGGIHGGLIPTLVAGEGVVMCCGL